MTRLCGTCYRCCVDLGIDALKKWPNQTCKNLSGLNPEKRCTIYDSRPLACINYRCAWLMGMGDEDQRPDTSGILITGYENDDKTHGITLIISDPKKSGSLNDTKSHLHRFIAEIFNTTDVVEVNIVNYNTKNMVILKNNGNIYSSKLLKPDSYEALTVETNTIPTASFRLAKL